MKNMKYKNIGRGFLKSIALATGVLVAPLFSLTSCEDMFTADNSLVSTDFTVQDTVYQVMGIVQRMQKLAERSVLLGEVRADLVDVNDYSKLDIKELANNNVSEENVYNSLTDYYGVINACNIYLANVDSLLMTHGERYYMREIAAVKAFRAWTYLELVKVYGKAKLITEPITEASVAEMVMADQTNVQDMATVLDYLIEDMRQVVYANPTLNLDLRPNYKASGSVNEDSRRFFIPARVMLGELYLWRGSVNKSTDDFLEAARHYHDFLTFPGEERTLTQTAASWANEKFLLPNLGAYSNLFERSNDEMITFIPLDTISYFGNTSELRGVFCSQPKNNYYAQVNPSEAMLKLSQAQSNLYFEVGSNKVVVEAFAPKEASSYTSESLMGDLRFAAVSSSTPLDGVDVKDNMSAERQVIVKYTNGNRNAESDQRADFVPLYRTSTIYLHMAEALNRAGFPETAFAILKYGLSDWVMNPVNGIIHAEEYNLLKNLSSVGIKIGEESTSFVDWSFEAYRNASADERDRAANFYTYEERWILETKSDWTTRGVHSRGSGRASMNKEYYLPTDSTGMQELPPVGPAPDPSRLLSGLPEDSAAYFADLEIYLAEVDAYNEVYDANCAYLASAPVKAERQAALQKMILDEEALECAYEGTRFYDLMRYAYFNSDPDFIANQVANRRTTSTSGASDPAEAANRIRGGKWFLTPGTK